MRRFRRDRRAVSPVLGTVILVLLVVLGMSLVFAFFVDYVSDYQRGRGSSVLELVEIEDVFFNPVDGNSSIDVWLYNYGKIEVEVDAIYVNGVLVQDFSYSGVSDFSGEPVLLDDVDADEAVEVFPDVHAKFKINMTLMGGWSSHVPYVLRVVTERGSAVERAYLSP